MINLRQGNNRVILTLDELDDTEGWPNYILKLKNAQTRALLSVDIEDVGPRNGRYNEFSITLVSAAAGMSIVADTTLDADTVYFSDGDVYVAAGATLTLPASTWVVMSAGSAKTGSGTVAGASRLISAQSYAPGASWWKSTAGVGQEVTTYLFSPLGTCYDYEAYSSDGTLKLEVGRCTVHISETSVKTYDAAAGGVVYDG